MARSPAATYSTREVITPGNSGTGSGTAGTWDPIAGPAVTLNTWVHLVGTFDGTVKRFYVNGTLAGTGTLSTFNPNTSRPLRIGAGHE